MPKPSLSYTHKKLVYGSTLVLFAASAFPSTAYGQASFTLQNDLGGLLTLEGSTATGIGFFDPGFRDTRPVSQITFAPGVNNQVYISTARDGIFRFDYDPTSDDPLTNQTLAVPASITNSSTSPLPSNGSLGLAFHRGSDGLTSAYLAPSVGFNGDRSFDRESEDYGIVSQSIFRVTDNNEDGRFGFGDDQSVAIVNNIRSTTLHQVNQLEVRDDTLFVNIGSSTNTGGLIRETFPGESQYTGTLSFIPDLNAVGASTNAAGFSFVNSGNATDLNGDGSLNQFEIDDAAARTDTQAFTSTADDKLRIYATGFRNNFGLGIRDDGAIFIGENENQRPQVEDQLNQVSFQSDHGFPSENDILDFRTNQDALDAGFFDDLQGGIPVGDNSSAVGLTFLGESAGPEFDGDVLLSRFAAGDILLVDAVSGESFTVVGDVQQGLDIARDPFGNFLITDAAGTIQVLAVDGVSTAIIPEPSGGLLLLGLGSLLLGRRGRSDG